MFHITNDKRALDSAYRICNGLKSLLRTQPFEFITISSLCIESQVSRPTFYRLFDTTSDVIRWYCDLSVQQLCAAYRASGLEGKEWPFRFNLRHILEHPDALELACKAGRIDLADNAFLVYMTQLLEPMRRELGVEENDLMLSGVVVSAIITSSFKAWLDGGKKDSPDVFYERVLRILQHIQ